MVKLQEQKSDQENYQQKQQNHPTTTADWKQKLLESDKTLTDSQIKLLKEGAKSLSQSWILGGLHKRYKDTFK